MTSRRKKSIEDKGARGLDSACQEQGKNSGETGKDKSGIFIREEEPWRHNRAK